MRKALHSESGPNPLQIISAFERDSLPGSIYVEARYPQQVQQSCSGLVGVHFSSGIDLVPVNEMASLLTLKQASPPVTPGSWVRIRRGTYHHDLAQVVDVSENGDITVRCVPRIDMRPRDDMSVGPKRKKDTAHTRHPQRLFHYGEVVKIYGRNAVSIQGQLCVFLNDSYKEGCVLKKFKLNSLILSNVNPTLCEIAMFSSSDAELEDGLMDFSSIIEDSRSAASSLIESGDRVKIVHGELVGVSGVVEETDGGFLTIVPVGMNLGKQIISARFVQKVFELGDHVKVITGRNAGETGLVVCVNENVVTFLGDMSMQEVSVFCTDLKKADQIGSGVKPAGKCQLHDLVQLR